MLLIMAGGTLSAAGSSRGSVTVPQGLNFVVVDVLGPSGFLSTPTDAFNTEVHVNKFYMDFYDSGEIWALQDGTSVVVGGKTNRSKGDFPDEMNRLLDKVPEIVESSISKQSDGISSG